MLLLLPLLGRCALSAEVGREAAPGGAMLVLAALAACCRDPLGADNDRSDADMGLLEPLDAAARSAAYKLDELPLLLMWPAARELLPWCICA